MTLPHVQTGWNAEPPRSWPMRRSVASVGAIGCTKGGRMEDGARNTVGILQWYGRCIGNHHLGAGAPRRVDFLKGANMSFRRTAIAGLRFDERLRGAGAQVGNDMAFSLALRLRGWTLLYDPLVAVDHYPAPRFDDDSRSHTAFRAHRNAAFNQALIVSETLGRARSLIFLGVGSCRGDASQPRATATRAPDRIWIESVLRVEPQRRSRGPSRAGPQRFYEQTRADDGGLRPRADPGGFARRRASTSLCRYHTGGSSLAVLFLCSATLAQLSRDDTGYDISRRSRHRLGRTDSRQERGRNRSQSSVGRLSACALRGRRGGSCVGRDGHSRISLRSRRSHVKGPGSARASADAFAQCASWARPCPDHNRPPGW